VVAGALVDPNTGDDSYGAVRRVDWHPMRFALVHPDGAIQDADTSHGNVLLVPDRTLRAVGGIDGGFDHAYADFDYGLRVRAAGGRVLLSPAPVGVCATNDGFHVRTRAAGNLRERLQVLRDVKGRPWRSELRFLRRHARVLWPVILAIPYVKAIAAGGQRPPALAGSDAAVVMLEGTASDYRAPLYRELITILGSDFLLGADTLAPQVAAAVTEAGGRFTKLSARRLATTWTHPDGFADNTSLVLFTRAYSVLRRERPAVVVVTEMGLRAAQAAIYALVHPSVRLVVWARLSERSEGGRTLPRLVLRRAIARRANAVIVNGASGARYCRSIGVGSTKIVVVPQVSAVVAASAADLEKRHRSIDTTRLLYVGQLIPRKGVDLLIRALAAANLPCTLRVVGAGPELEAVRELSERLHVAVEFVDWIHDPAQLQLEYRAADFFVLPTLVDEWGLVIVEALSQGTPVLGSVYSDAVAELVVEGQNGFTFAPDDATSLSAALAGAAALDADRWRLASAAAAGSVAAVTVAQVAEQFRAVIAGDSPAMKRDG
jgi:hypothetical protein